MSASVESLDQFLEYKLNSYTENMKKDFESFKVFRIEDRIVSGVTSPSYIRRDFYKIMLYQGSNVFHFGDKSVAVSGNTLLFFNPLVPYTYDPLPLDTKGFFCVFNEDFFDGSLRIDLSKLPLFVNNTKPIFELNQSESEEFNDIFAKIINESSSKYTYKYELIRTYVCELIYFAMKLQPSETLIHQSDASSRITNIFLELLERQFPIESVSQRFEFRSPQQFADKLSIHVNYLNRAIKKHTGKTTTDIICDRIISEAKALLKYTDWNVSEISYSLGFEDQSNFNKFFKKRAHFSPLTYRTVSLSANR